MNHVARVGEISDQIRGVTFAKAESSDAPGPGLLPVLRAGNIQDGRLDLADLVYVPEARVRQVQRLRVNDVVIAASSGSIDVVGKAARTLEEDFQGGFGAFLKVLRPGPEVDPSYFAHFFQTSTYRRTVSRLAAGANINNLKNEHLDNLEIPLPPIEEQRRIAAILDKADSIRDAMLNQGQTLALLPMRLFRSTFGSSRTVDLASRVKFRSGSFLPKGAMKPGDVTVYGANGVTGLHNEPLFDEAVVTVGRVGSCGAVNWAEGPSWVTDNALVVTAGDTTLQLKFARYALQAADLGRFASQSNQPLISQARVAAAQIPDVDDRAQAEFLRRVHGLDSVRSLSQRRLQRQQSLMEALQARAFSGRL